MLVDSIGYRRGASSAGISCGKSLPHQSCIDNRGVLPYTAIKSKGSIPCRAYAEKGAAEGQTVVRLGGKRANARGLVNVLVADGFCTKLIR